MKKFTVLGTNVSISKSPKLFNYIFTKLNINAEYSFIEINNRAHFNSFLESKDLMNFSGINITMPYKSNIINYSDFQSENVKITNSSNCVNINKSKMMCHNTDIDGFTNLLKMNNVNLNNLSVLVIGSGGSASSIIMSLISQQVKNISLLSRNFKSSTNLINRYKKYNPGIQSFTKLSNYDAIINCTPIGVCNNTDDTILKNLKKSQYLIDINYINNMLSKSIFSEYADCYINGVDMFLFQALASLDVWFKDKLSKKINYNKLVKLITYE